MLIVLCLSGTQLRSAEYISCKLWGQLGNQLFLIASTLGMAWDNNAIPVFPDLEIEQTWNVPVNKELIYFRLNTAHPENIVFSDKQLNFYKKIDYTKNIRLTGFDTRFDYFGHHQERLQEIFAPSDEIERIIQSKFGFILSSQNHVGMHIRVCANDILPFSTWEYYLSAMELFPNDTLFLICSDRIEWVKKHFPTKTKNIIFIDDNHHYLVDFYLLTKCKNLIIGASTFGYWAAFLNKNSNKKVIAPSLWLSHKDPRTLKGFPHEWNVYPKEWTVLTVPLVRNVPEDILQYKTSSCDW